MGLVTRRDERYSMTLKGAFYYHYYENFYTLAYIDKMWGVLRNEAFPERSSCDLSTAGARRSVLYLILKKCVKIRTNYRKCFYLRGCGCAKGGLF